MSETRDRILSCACDLYLEDGWDGFSMRRLARSAGLTAPALYRHFEGKEHLLLEVVKEAYKVMAQYLHRALGGQSPAERFGMAGKGYLEFALEHPRYYEILYSYIPYLGITELPGELEELVCGIHQFWLDRVRECIAAGLLEPEDPDVITRSFWALSHGLIALYQRGMLPITEEELREVFRRSAGHLFGGVATPEGRVVFGVAEEGVERGERSVPGGAG
jgi:AcrR family transcriptional regulator